MILVMAKKGTWILEQPASSLVFRLKRFQELLQITKASSVHLGNGHGLKSHKFCDRIYYIEKSPHDTSSRYTANRFG